MRTPGRPHSPIRLVLSDVDGTLIDDEKRLTDETVRAVQLLKENDILFSVTSARPPRGFAMFLEPLELTAPLGAFNGGLMVNPDMSVISELAVDETIVGPTIEALTSSELSVWVYQGTDWFVLDLNGPHVVHESGVVQFHPSLLKSFDEVRRDVVKIVGVSDNPAAVAKGQVALQGLDVSATTSQTYYLDVTNPRANKGSVVDFLAKYYSIGKDAIATIGDAGNDVAMFENSGLSIAMGNGPDEVKSRAYQVTKSNEDNGFAYALEHLIVPHAKA